MRKVNSNRPGYGQSRGEVDAEKNKRKERNLAFVFFVVDITEYRTYSCSILALTSMRNRATRMESHLKDNISL